MVHFGAMIMVWVHVPVAFATGWKWGVWDKINPCATEVVQSPTELASVLRSVGRVVAQQMRGADRFALTAYDADDRVYGRDVWLYSPDAHMYVPFDEPWCPRAITAEAVATDTAYMGQAAA